MTATQEDVNNAVRDIADQLKGLPLVVQPNAYGHRIQCAVPACGWSKCYGTVQGAKDHAATHTPSLFSPELDGQTFPSLEALSDWQAEAANDYGPVWSNYGGWVN
ncbi:hypothetical protein [Streptomyces cyaneofuscatus]|uniref:hypothetical protein n=1 Tax=Streptomyces cyaneofuscatus TaxID=66883 RepID=UPI0036294315